MNCEKIVLSLNVLLFVSRITSMIIIWIFVLNWFRLPTNQSIEWNVGLTDLLVIQHQSCYFIQFLFISLILITTSMINGYAFLLTDPLTKDHLTAIIQNTSDRMLF